MNKSAELLELLELHSWIIQLSHKHSASYSRILLDSLCQTSEPFPLQWPHFHQWEIDAVTKQGLRLC